jgi:hypothetical protein
VLESVFEKIEKVDQVPAFIVYAAEKVLGMLRGLVQGVGRGGGEF